MHSGDRRMSESVPLHTEFWRKRGQPFKGKRREINVSLHTRSARNNAPHFRSLKLNRLNRSPVMDTHIRESGPTVRGVEFAERNRRDSHFVSVRCRKKAQPENLEAVLRGHAIQFFIDRTYQHLTPETFDGALRLVLLLQPIEHRDFVEVGS